LSRGEKKLDFYWKNYVVLRIRILVFNPISFCMSEKCPWLVTLNQNIQQSFIVCKRLGKYHLSDHEPNFSSPITFGLKICWRINMRKMKMNTVSSRNCFYSILNFCWLDVSPIRGHRTVRKEQLGSSDAYWKEMFFLGGILKLSYML